MYQEDMVKAKNNGLSKAITLPVRIIWPSTHSLAPIINWHIILFLQLSLVFICS